MAMEQGNRDPREESLRARMKNLNVVTFDSCGTPSIDSLESAISLIEEHDKLFPPEKEVERIREALLSH